MHHLYENTIKQTSGQWIRSSLLILISHWLRNLHTLQS
jgi:hypothetical protein